MERLRVEMGTDPTGEGTIRNTVEDTGTPAIADGEDINKILALLPPGADPRAYFVRINNDSIVPLATLISGATTPSTPATPGTPSAAPAAGTASNTPPATPPPPDANAFAHNLHLSYGNGLGGASFGLGYGFDKKIEENISLDFSADIVRNVPWDSKRSDEPNLDEIGAGLTRAEIEEQNFTGATFTGGLSRQGFLGVNDLTGRAGLTVGAGVVDAERTASNSIDYPAIFQGENGIFGNDVTSPGGVDRPTGLPFSNGIHTKKSENYFAALLELRGTLQYSVFKDWHDLSLDFGAHAFGQSFSRAGGRKSSLTYGVGVHGIVGYSITENLKLTVTPGYGKIFGDGEDSGLFVVGGVLFTWGAGSSDSSPAAPAAVETPVAPPPPEPAASTSPTVATPESVPFTVKEAVAEETPPPSPIAVPQVDTAPVTSLSVEGPPPPEPVLVANPTITPNGGNFTSPIEVRLGDETAEASIYYTLDGSDPETQQTPQTLPYHGNALSFTKSCTIRAIAMKGGVGKSEIVEATFTITPPPPPAPDGRPSARLTPREPS